VAANIVIKGARVHNLKNVDLEIPRDQFVVVTGVSGSGKSSLAFDTLYAEGRRRYLESLGADARQLLQQIEKPDVDSIDGLSPTIAIQQKPGLASPRSTVGTITGVYDFLRLLFVRAGQLTCVECGHEIRAHSVEQIVDQLLSLPAQTRVMVLAPLALPVPARLEELARQGFARVMVDGRMTELAGELPLAIEHGSRIDLVIDRLVLRDGIRKRLAESIEIAARHGDQIVKVRIVSESDADDGREMAFSQKFVCLNCGVPAPEITPGLFSFNSPEGACPRCNGLGEIAERRKRLKDSATVPCPECGGSRLKKTSRAVRIGGHDITEIAAMPIAATLELLSHCQFAEGRKIIGEKIVDQITGRLGVMTQLGLDYLSLDRSSVTLSGGELQRVRLATQMGSGMAGILYVLDEPSMGLHQKDNAKLIDLLKQLRDAGNSVLVVEHDPETMRAADYLIDMGPGAGDRGGEVIACGVAAEILRDSRSLTGRYLSGALKVPLPAERRKGAGKGFVIKNARARNLKNLTVEIPIGVMTCVTGVSGAGKSTLVMEVLYRGLQQRLQRMKVNDAGAELIGWQQFDRAIGVDQNPIGRTQRSNAATYTGIYDHLREFFAALPEARVRGYKPDRFSFNMRGGRCEACAGEGVTRIEMYFIPELFVTCPVCKGRRYNRETLDVKYKGLSIADLLDLTVDEASELLNNIAPIHDRLRTLREVGLGYLRLGQPAATLAGGEAQRVKLARELARKSTGQSLYVLDEPTTGLHFDDVRKLLEVLHRLVDTGNTVVVIEHNLEVIKTADWIIDLGPEGGDKGGELVVAGTPERVAATPASYTGQFLASYLGSAAKKKQRVRA
jgi:excinuclease ABC subunit A